MSERIIDGRGRGYEVEVNSDHKLEVLSTTRTEMTYHSERDGDTFMFATNGHIDVPVANTTYGILYVKNTSETKDLYIESIRSCGSAVNKWNIYKNPTASTVISNANNGVKNSINFTSATTPDVTVYQGTGTNFTGGSLLENWVNGAGHSVEVYGGAMILGKNDSIGIAGSIASSGDLCVRVIGYNL